ncbi:ankyrin repeat-containing domain protein [Trichoderma aethiopicum]
MPAPDDIPMPLKRLTHKDYSVGWICALWKEKAAAEAMLEEIHFALPQPDRDPYTYTLGSIGNHNVVVACLPEIGTNSAANLVTQMINTFPSMRFCLMVGIGGGIPPQVRLGDIVVSKPMGAFPGVVQWDLGKSEKAGFRRTGALDRPPKVLLTALEELRKSHDMYGTHLIPAYMKNMEVKYPNMAGKYTRSPDLRDPMLEPHKRRNPVIWASVATVIFEVLVVLVRLLSGRYEPEGQDMPSEPKPDNDDGQSRTPEIHYGLIASGNQVIKDSAVRDQINRDLGGEVLCLEMEAAGLMNNFPCIVIRGICDYADAQKSKEWQEYAAALAAAFAKELLQHVQSVQVAMERPIKDVLQQVSDIKSQMDQDEVSKVLDWLTTANHGQQHTTHLRSHTKGTCQWIFETEQLQSWLSGSPRTLLCQGMPGSGKTIITSVVIDHLTTRFMDDPTIGIAYLYCTFSHPKLQTAELQTTEQLLSSVLRQLASSCDPFPASTKKLYEKHKAKDSRPSREQLAADIEAVANLYTEVYVVIDAIDECHLPSVKQFFDVLFERQSSCNMNIFATSRFIPEVEQWFNGARSAFLKIRAERSDIAKYVEAELQHSSTNVIKDDPKIQEEIKLELSQAADGMFLLARLYLELLRDKTTIYDVRDQLQTFNLDAGVRSDKVLTEAYERVFGRINGQPSGLKDLATRVLLWLTFAKRELTISELRHGVATKEGLKTIGDDRLSHIRDIGRACAGLLTIDEETGIIQLVHYTAHEFLAEYALFRACITYLSFTDFESGFCETDDEFEQRQKRFPLCNYAASHWGDHLPKHAKPSRDLLEYLGNAAKVEASVQAQHAVKHYSSQANYSQDVPRGLTGLHLAAYFGLTGLTKALLEERLTYGCSPSSSDSDGQTPLLWAARHGHEEVVSLLIDSSTSIEVRDMDQGATPLIWAARNGHEKVVHLLLDKGGELNARDHLERTPLSLAASSKHESIIKLLLKRGGVIHPNDEAGKVKLLATRLDPPEHHTVLEMLFGDESRPESVCNGKKQMIPYTAENYSELAMQRLLDGGDHINEVDQHGRTLLSRAAERGDEQVVEMLIKSGKADINARDQQYGETPLIWAARKGHYNVVKLLLDADADVNVQEQRKGETALTLAIESRHEATIRELIAKGADVNNRDHTNHTPLHTASWQGSVPVMQMLLVQKVDVNASNDDGRTPIFSACALGHIDLVRLLLNSGADIEARDDEYRTPLFFAAALGQTEIVGLLLRNGADIRARNRDGRTAIFSAIGSGDMKVVNLLLDASHVDEVHKADEEGVRPIDWAEETGHKHIIRLIRAKTI